MNMKKFDMRRIELNWEKFLTSLDSLKFPSESSRTRENVSRHELAAYLAKYWTRLLFASFRLDISSDRFKIKLHRFGSIITSV